MFEELDEVIESNDQVVQILLNLIYIMSSVTAFLIVWYMDIYGYEFYIVMASFVTTIALLFAVVSLINPNN